MTYEEERKENIIDLIKDFDLDLDDIRRIGRVDELEEKDYEFGEPERQLSIYWGLMRGLKGYYKISNDELRRELSKNMEQQLRLNLEEKRQMSKLSFVELLDKLKELGISATQLELKCGFSKGYFANMKKKSLSSRKEAELKGKIWGAWQLMKKDIDAVLEEGGEFEEV